MQISKKMIKHEIMAIKSNFFMLFFGIVFPLFMVTIISVGIGSSVPSEFLLRIKTEIALSILLMIPLAISFMSVGAATLLEFENNIPERMNLFGFKYRNIFGARLIMYTLFMVLSIVIYLTYCVNVLEIESPTISGILITMIFLGLISTALIAAAFGISKLVPRFQIGYGIVMLVYFFFLFIGGMMGITVHNMPEALTAISKTLPFSYFQTDVIYFTWMGESANLMPLIQSTIFFLGLCFLLLGISFYVHRRRVENG